MKLESSAFKNGELIPKKHTYDGQDISPALFWSEVPTGTKSFALIMEDPGAKIGIWRHWAICNISKEVRNIPENSTPEKCHLIRNHFGKREYGGPCSPRGTHQYLFKLFAINVDKLDHLNEVSCQSLIEKHVIDQAELMGIYHR